MIKLSSRIPGFYKLPQAKRIEKLAEIFDLIPSEVKDLSSQGSLTLDQADKMIENAVGIYSLPIGLGLNFLINNKEYIVPMAVEEPSVIAAASSAAKIIRDAGGFITDSDESIMIGQIQVLNCQDFELAKTKVLQRKNEIIDLANRTEPKMFSRGGGAKDLEIRILGDESEYPYCKMMIINLLIDTKDAMGANAINTMVEGVAGLVEDIAEGKVCLKILSNLADKRLARAKAVISPRLLDSDNYKGEEVIEGILQAQAFAYLDPYRATTHNKGVMNGIDPVIIVTGNDWRSIEAGAHAYAARTGKYLPLTDWRKDDQGNLVGKIELPMAIGIVGGSINLHPMAQIALKFLGVKTARELGEVICAVGLAQNFSAMKALSTDGIQKGHMALHARSVAVTAGASGEVANMIAREMVKQRDVKVDKAKELFALYSSK
ncbi:MAG: hydroxymethylglutaryl-CoA reductase, degradative [Candidatus Sericytochromatia bacterium]|nr:hydroxymethylglutaryl-CoA reductase, degradative [Candidatus Sericytochromatia bacterium]